MSSPHLNNLIIVGCMLTYLSVIFLGLDSSLSSIGKNFLVYIWSDGPDPLVCLARALWFQMTRTLLGWTELGWFCAVLLCHYSCSLCVLSYFRIEGKRIWSFCFAELARAYECCFKSLATVWFITYFGLFRFDYVFWFIWMLEIFCAKKILLMDLVFQIYFSSPHHIKALATSKSTLTTKKLIKHTTIKRAKKWKHLSIRMSLAQSPLFSHWSHRYIHP